ncbi:hypothetical protein Tco_1530433 [Tanacetum coccineum]
MVVLGAKRPWGASVQTRFERASKLSHDSPLGGGNTPRSDEDSMTLQELTDFYTKLSHKVLALETYLRRTKKVYGTAYTKLIMKVKKLEKTVKSNQTRRRAKIVVSYDDMALEDSSKQERMIEEIDQDVGVSLVTPIKVSSQEDQPKDQLGVLSATKVLADAARVHTYSGKRRAVSTGSGGVSTAEETVSTVGASMPVSTAGIVQQVNIIIPLSRAIKDKARVEADEELTRKLQAEERDKYCEVDQAKMLQVESSKRRSREDFDEESAKKQQLEDEVEKEELRACLDIVPGDDVAMDVESLATNKMLNDLDRQDVMDLHRLVKERLFDSCGVHVLLMDTGVAIHMLIEKKYPLIQEMLSKILNRRLEVDHESEMALELLRFTRSQFKK